MVAPSFYKHAVVIDLHSTSPNSKISSVLIPAAVVLEFAAIAGEQKTFEQSRIIGQKLGERVLAQVGGHEYIRNQPMDAMVHSLATEFAIAGLGVLSLERWGRAFVFVVEASPWSEHALGRSILSAIVEGLLSTITQQEIHAKLIHIDDARLRILIGNSTSLERVSTWLREGVSWGDALIRLHGLSEDESSTLTKEVFS